eukprot:COSAG05_NODE_112_length_18489_cov_15.556281_7_plen_148_part_00
MTAQAAEATKGHGEDALEQWVVKAQQEERQRRALELQVEQQNAEIARLTPTKAPRPSLTAEDKAVEKEETVARALDEAGADAPAPADLALTLNAAAAHATPTKDDANKLERLASELAELKQLFFAAQSPVRRASQQNLGGVLSAVPA